MEAPQTTTYENSSEQKAKSLISQFGIGHLPQTTLFSIESINQLEKEEVIETYQHVTENINNLITIINSIIQEQNTEQRSVEVFEG